MSAPIRPTPPITGLSKPLMPAAPRWVPSGPIKPAPCLRGVHEHRSGHLATGVALTNVVIDWADSTGATSYDLYFGTANPPPSYQTGLAASTYTVLGPLTASTVYYWYVIANDACSQTATGRSGRSPRPPAPAARNPWSTAASKAAFPTLPGEKAPLTSGPRFVISRDAATAAVRSAPAADRPIGPGSAALERSRRMLSSTNRSPSPPAGRHAEFLGLER